MAAHAMELLHKHIHTHNEKSAFHLCPFTLSMTKTEGISANTIHFTVLSKKVAQHVVLYKHDAVCGFNIS